MDSRTRTSLLLMCLLVGVGITPALADETPGVTPVTPAVSPRLARLRLKAPKFDFKLVSNPLFRQTPPEEKKKEDAKKDEKKQDAVPATPPAPEPGAVTVTGLVDVYYSINARAPRSATNTPVGAQTFPNGESLSFDNTARFFDINDRDPSFSLGEINITRTPSKQFNFGVTGTFTVGDSARLFHATEPGGTSSWSFLTNLFLTYNTKVMKHDIAIDFGKFVSPFGLEVLESVNNDNYSRAFDFWYGVPFYHTGLRATGNITPQITLQVGVVNGWNDTADSNNAKTIYAQGTWKPNAKFTQTLSYIGGLEGTGAFGAGVATNGGGGVTINLLDATSVYQLTPKTKLSFWADYGSAAGNVVGANGGGSGHLSGNWISYVGYVRHQLTDKIAFAGRVEQFEDMGGGSSGYGTPRYGFTGGNYLKLNEVTLTAEYLAFKGRLTTRLEYRHDWASSAIYGAGSGGTVRDQDTVSLSFGYKF